MTIHAPRRSAILVLPTTTEGQQGPVAGWLSTVGWASGVDKVIGRSWIVTTSGIVDQRTARRRAASDSLASPSKRTAASRAPVLAKTAWKDAREWRRSRTFSIDPDGPWRGDDVAFVWQRHELFHHAGLDLAQRLGVPSVVFVPAPLVWQARQWGTSRPGWGSLLERFGESRLLRRADVVAAGTCQVAEQLQRLGVRSERIAITPTGVDPEQFTAPTDKRSVKESLGLTDRFVVGWIGSFRKFHGLERAVDALRGLDNATLLLIGDGPERHGIEDYAHANGIACLTTGTVAHELIPRMLRAMDVALVLSVPNQAFHYSPLKLAEYLAAGIPVVAPRAGSVSDSLRHGVEALLFDPADPQSLAALLQELRGDSDLRARLSAAGRAAAVERFSWEHPVGRVVDAVNAIGRP